MPDSLLAQFENHFMVNAVEIVKININTDSVRHLSQHPYLNWNQARAIINYRKVHGDYEVIESIKTIKVIPDSVYNRIAPYLTIAPEYQ
jgi:DNA uptake protein ComE-like DNA-binding protein